MAKQWKKRLRIIKNKIVSPAGRPAQPQRGCSENLDICSSLVHDISLWTECMRKLSKNDFDSLRIKITEQSDWNEIGEMLAQVNHYRDFAWFAHVLPHNDFRDGISSFAFGISADATVSPIKLMSFTEVARTFDQRQMSLFLPRPPMKGEQRGQPHLTAFFQIPD